MNYGSEKLPKFPKQHRLPSLPLVSHHNDMIRPQTSAVWQWKQFQTETLSLLTSFHRAKRCYAGCWEVTDTNGPSQHWDLNAAIPTYQSRWTSAAIVALQQGLTVCYLLYRREFHAGTIILVKSPWLDYSPFGRSCCCYQVIGHAGKLPSKYLLLYP